MTQPAAPRKIVICIDGTGNEIGARATNILKLYKTLDKHAPDQEAHYFMGVGTYAGPQLFARTRQAVLGLLGRPSVTGWKTTCSRLTARSAAATARRRASWPMIPA